MAVVADTAVDGVAAVHTGGGSEVVIGAAGAAEHEEEEVGDGAYPPTNQLAAHSKMLSCKNLYHKSNSARKNHVFYLRGNDKISGVRSL